MATAQEGGAAASGSTEPEGPVLGGGGAHGPERSKLAELFTGAGLRVVAGWIGVALVVYGVWQYAATHGYANPVFTGTPSKILAEFWDGLTGPPALVHARATVTAAIIGSAVASVLGIAVAFVLAQSDTWRRIFNPYFTVLNGLPRVALAPLFLLWFGIGPLGKIMLAGSISFFVTFYNTMVGVDSVDRDHLLLARALGASRLQVFLKFVVPSAVPSIFAGLQLGFVYGMLGTVATEMLAGEAGLGVLLTRQAALFQMDGYFATLTLLALATTAISGALEIARRRLLRWQHAHVVKV
ncbi:MAG: ABC transporter permease [Burkholderiales bacterium]